MNAVFTLALLTAFFYCTSGQKVEYQVDFSKEDASKWAKNGIGSIVKKDGVACLKLTFHKGKNHEDGEQGERKIALPPAAAKTLEYSVFFENGFDFVNHGGKLPGLIGGAKATGCVDPTPDGWSARFMWRQQGAFVLYLYNQDRPGKGECGIDVKTTAPNFQTGRWYAIREYVKVNTPGKKNGVVKVWVDGKQVLSKSDIAYRGAVSANVALVDRFYFSTFVGGSWKALKDSTLYFKGFKVTSAT